MVDQLVFKRIVDIYPNLIIVLTILIVLTLIKITTNIISFL
jgi:hypothetical protein